MPRRRAAPMAAAALLLLVTMLSGGSAPGQIRPILRPPRPELPDKVVLRVYESTFNALAQALGTLKLTGHYTFNASACVPGTSVCTSTEICSSDWTATVTALRFTISPSKIAVTGHGNASWCGVSTGFALETTADVAKASIVILQPGTHHPMQTQDAIRVSVSPTSVQPVVNIPGYSVKLPIHIDVAPSLTLPPIPLATSLVSFETAAGPQSLRLSPSQSTIAKRDHYIELQTGLRLW